MASPTQWTWVWVGSGSWWWTGRPGCCHSWGCKESDTTERLNWTENTGLNTKSVEINQLFFFPSSKQTHFCEILCYVNVLVNFSFPQFLLFCVISTQFNMQYSHMKSPLSHYQFTRKWYVGIHWIFFKLLHFSLFNRISCQFCHLVVKYWDDYPHPSHTLLLVLLLLLLLPPLLTLHHFLPFIFGQHFNFFFFFNFILFLNFT